MPLDGDGGLSRGMRAEKIVDAHAAMALVSPTVPNFSFEGLAGIAIL
jgi:hypothetical protein